MFSTASDLARLAIAVMNGGKIDGAQAVPARAIASATAAHAEMPGVRTPTAYGYGFRIDTHRGFRQAGHFGGGMGFGAVLRMLPERNAAVVVLANRTNALLNDVADTAFAAILGETGVAEASSGVPAAFTPLTASEARELAGTYRNGEQSIALVLRDGQLFLSDDDALLPVRRSGTDEVAAVDAGGAAVLRMVVVHRPGSGHRYVFLLGRAFRRQAE
jgi:hypothetical protein